MMASYIFINTILIFFFSCNSIKITAQNSPELNNYNVVWNSPSESSFGSMPLGNGDIGLNVWVEKNGDLLFYISKVDALDYEQIGKKLGRIRIKMFPSLPVNEFKQTLNLSDASVLIEAGDVNLRLWVDANLPVIRLEGKSRVPRTATITLEYLRPMLDATEPLPDKGTVGVLFNEKENRLIWCYRNQSSGWWAENLRSQNTPEMVARTKDPLLFRTSGCMLQAKNFTRENGTTLRLKRKSTVFDCSVKVISTQPENLQVWLSEVTKPVKSDWEAHCAYWKSFWNRSYIRITSGGTGKFNLDQYRFTQFSHQSSKIYEGHKQIDASANVFQISQRYALERFCEAAASRGTVPPNANGSLFTMDMPSGVPGGYDKPKETPTSPNYRDWQECCWFMNQNIRFPYWSMVSRGDYDCIVPGMKFIHDGLDIAKDHTKKIFGHEGAFLFEANAWLNVGVFNWENNPTHLRHHFLGTLEFPAIMCEYYEHTRDREFLEDILLPSADEFLKFYEIHYPKDDNGIIQLEGGAVESYRKVTNPVTEIGGLKYVLTKLLSFEIDKKRRERWSNFLETMPGNLPVMKIRGVDLLSVGEKYEPKASNGEHPELYSVYPFRQVWLGKPELLQTARQSFHVRNISVDGSTDDRMMETGGWQMSPVQAAYLGLPREAARLASISFNDQFVFYSDNIDTCAPYPNRPRARFPAFWETKTDGTPDNDHGAASVNALQSMLLQSDGKKIFLLPAWPEDWDVEFKLKAAHNTTVEGIYRDGQVQSLKVTPASRTSDIIDMSTARQRIRTMVEVALTDHNYLFGIPPMLDAMPIPGKVTGPWIAKYGYTIEGCKAGPWLNSLFKGNIVYIHILDWPEEGVRLPSISRKLVSFKSVTGNIQVKQDGNGWLLTGTPDTLNTIVKLEFDNSIEDIAMGLPSAGSFTAGRERTIKFYNGYDITAEVDLGVKRILHRFEFTISNPGYLRMHGRPYEIQVQENDGTWQTAHKGNIYGIICGKEFEQPVNAKAVRLIVRAPEIKQFDVF